MSNAHLEDLTQRTIKELNELKRLILLQPNRADVMIRESQERAIQSLRGENTALTDLVASLRRSLTTCHREKAILMSSIDDTEL